MDPVEISIAKVCISFILAASVCISYSDLAVGLSALFVPDWTIWMEGAEIQTITERRKHKLFFKTFFSILFINLSTIVQHLQLRGGFFKQSLSYSSCFWTFLHRGPLNYTTGLYIWYVLINQSNFIYIALFRQFAICSKCHLSFCHPTSNGWQKRRWNGFRHQCAAGRTIKNG